MLNSVKKLKLSKGHKRFKFTDYESIYLMLENEKLKKKIIFLENGETGN
jgi:hypothetical protein